jgi:Lar family restriction alleviation protein
VNELLPCPFCGSDPIECATMSVFDGAERYAVICSENSCGASKTAMTRHEAIEKWNTRAPTQDMADAERFRKLMRIGPYQATLSLNEQRSDFVTAREYIATTGAALGIFDEETEEQREAMAAADTIWELHVYPHGQVTYWRLHDATLRGLVDRIYEADLAPEKDNE